MPITRCDSDGACELIKVDETNLLDEFETAPLSDPFSIRQPISDPKDPRWTRKVLIEGFANANRDIKANHELLVATQKIQCLRFGHDGRNPMMGMNFTGLDGPPLNPWRAGRTVFQ